MSARIRAHIRGNIIGYVALFFALSTGSAVALNGTNTVFTDDIVNDQVYSLDVRNDTLSGGGLAAPDLRPNAVGTSEVANGSLTGTDILESSLGQVPSASDSDSLGGTPAASYLQSGDAASGDLTGTYPSPDIQGGAVGTAEFASSIPAVHATHSAVQSIASTTNTTLAFDTERYDTANMHDNSTNNSRLTAPLTGIYAVSAVVQWDGAVSGGTRIITINKNGATGLAGSGGFAVTGGGSESTPVTTMVRLQAGDYVEAIAFQTSSSSVNVHKSEEITPEFSMTWLAPGP